jgi:hypothetical protein
MGTISGLTSVITHYSTPWGGEITPFPQFYA